MPALARMIETCWVKTGSYLNVLYPGYGRTDQGIENHRRIIAALRARDPEGLVAAIRTDIENASAALQAAIRARRGAGPPGNGAG